jgi:hypothetical protein
MRCKRNSVGSWVLPLAGFDTQWRVASGHNGHGTGFKLPLVMTAQVVRVAEGEATPPIKR